MPFGKSGKRIFAALAAFSLAIPLGIHGQTVTSASQLQAALNTTATPGSFSVKTIDPSRDSAPADAGLNADINRTITVFTDYESKSVSRITSANPFKRA